MGDAAHTGAASNPRDAIDGSGDGSTSEPPIMHAIAVQHQLDVKELHARALQKLETLGDRRMGPKHAALFFESVEKREGTAQQQKGDCMACLIL